jgi:glycosyltransferase involved in cell wall biosynthesis
MGLRYLGETGAKRKILYMLEKAACKNSTHVECVSPSNLQLATEAKLFKASKGKVVWNGSSGGIDLHRFDVKNRGAYRAEIRAKYGIDEKDFVFGFVGRITKDKGVNELLESFLQMQGCKLMMVGPMEDVESLNAEQYQQSLSNENVIYTGSVKEIEKYFCAMDVLVFPSYREGFGNVVMEAAAMGTTSIVANIPGPVDIVRADHTALLVEPRDAKDLQHTMQELFTDREKTERLSNNAVEHVALHFDQEILMQHILETKNTLLKDHDE